MVTLTLTLYETMGKAGLGGSFFGLGEEVIRAIKELAVFHFILTVVDAAWDTMEFSMEAQPMRASD